MLGSEEGGTLLKANMVLQRDLFTQWDVETIYRTGRLIQ